MRIVQAARVADPIEELEDLDGPLATEAHGVAEVRGIDAAAFAAQRANHPGELRDAFPIVVEISHHLTDASLSEELAQHRANPIIGLAHGTRQIAHPGRIEASGGDQGPELSGEDLVCLGERHPRSEEHTSELQSL